MDAMSKIKGCLLGAAIGDAMGAATEVRTRQQIIEKFGKPVREFLPPPDDTFARGSKAGQVTDDYSMIQCRATTIFWPAKTERRPTAPA